MHSISRALRFRTPLAPRPLLFASAILVAGVAFNPREAAGQTITGRITDRQNGQGISGANVRVPGTQQGTVSRSDGTYRLTLPVGRHPLLVSYIGYVPRRDTVTLAAGETQARDYSLDRGIAE